MRIPPEKEGAIRLGVLHGDLWRQADIILFRKEICGKAGFIMWHWAMCISLRPRFYGRQDSLCLQRKPGGMRF